MAVTRPNRKLSCCWLVKARMLMTEAVAVARR
jgi:hypothetical protein